MIVVAFVNHNASQLRIKYFCQNLELRYNAKEGQMWTDGLCICFILVSLSPSDKTGQMSLHPQSVHPSKHADCWVSRTVRHFVNLPTWTNNIHAQRLDAFQIKRTI